MIGFIHDGLLKVTTGELAGVGTVIRWVAEVVGEELHCRRWVHTHLTHRLVHENTMLVHASMLVLAGSRLGPGRSVLAHAGRWLVLTGRFVHSRSVHAHAGRSIHALVS
jgi:hypothetical protein